MILEAERNANFPFFRVCPLSLIFVLSFRISLVLIYCKRLSLEPLVGRNRAPIARNHTEGTTSSSDGRIFRSLIIYGSIELEMKFRATVACVLNTRFIVSRYISWVRSIYNRFLFRASKNDRVDFHSCLIEHYLIYYLALVSGMLLFENK